MIHIDLTINTNLVRKILTGFIRSEITRVGLQRAVIGLSGGIDSALSAYLAVEALGAENVLAVCMPYRSSVPESLAHAQLVIDQLKIPSVVIPITEMVEPLFQRDPQMSQTRRGNIMARARMIILYDQSAVFRGLVVGTSNKTEIMLGYSTLYGDSAYAINPIGDLYKAQVRQLARAMGVPQVILDKPPTADLWQGQTDEGELGFTYEMADKLRESERINSEYEENRKTLIVNISHDLKTPMTSIQGYIEIILEGGITQPDKLQRYLQTIYNNSTYMNKLIDDLFLFSKLDMDKMDFNYESLQVRPFMEDLMTEFKFELEEKNYGFSYQDKMEKDCLISIDGKRVYQAIRNIIGNAVKYGPENNLQVTVELYEQGDFACLDIQDNGPGIPEDKLPYIFERFYRIDTERSKDFMSTGLGLAITKELVEAQGGKISVSSSGDVGTCFTVCLPVKTPPESSLTL